MNHDIIDVQTETDRMQGLKAWGWVSYVLHLVVALGAVIPGAQPGAALLIIALVIDLVKKGDARGTWQASHFDWRIRSVLWAGVRARHGSHGKRPGAQWLSCRPSTPSILPCKAVVHTAL